MNRLIVIGNGFDLAHGMKTSYKDFIAHYLAKAYKILTEYGYYSDDLIDISFRNGDMHYINPYLDYTNPNRDYIKSTIELLKNSYNIEIIIHSLVLKNSLAKIEKMNWVDLEVEYFNVLLATKHGYKNSNQLEAIQKVNNQLDFLKSKLCEYLKEQQSHFTNGFDKKPLVDCFTELINSHEIVTTELEKDERPKNLFFLNFNYTNTFENYFDSCREIIPSEFDYIHGNLSEVHGKPVFGFGDELDKRYLEFEDEKNNELFRHIKSFEYLKNKNYYRLIRFLESDNYQVQIYGHSCGLSDRTMLNTIFENDNCKSIKIFYHKRDDETNDYTEKTYEISRHFKDKGIMRKKIVPFDYSEAMPQPK